MVAKFRSWLLLSSTSILLMSERRTGVSARAGCVEIITRHRRWQRDFLITFIFKSRNSKLAARAISRTPSALRQAQGTSLYEGGDLSPRRGESRRSRGGVSVQIASQISPLGEGYPSHYLHFNLPRYSSRALRCWPSPSSHPQGEKLEASAPRRHQPLSELLPSRALPFLSPRSSSCSLWRSS